MLYGGDPDGSGGGRELIGCGRSEKTERRKDEESERTFHSERIVARLNAFGASLPSAPQDVRNCTLPVSLFTIFCALIFVSRYSGLTIRREKDAPSASA
jgi:hypothetical protein